ncbi:MAG: TetR/AcrR family transcriptional regulator [Solirubrobacteraceae bacterium]|jgi:AcrR family transcriptional regulator
MSAKVAAAIRMSAAERREQLLDAAKAIIDRSGFYAVSIEAVAREAGITRPVVYGHFQDLAGLLDALIEREGERALRQLETVLPGKLSEGDSRGALMAAMKGYLEAARSDPATWRLVLMPPEGAPQSLRSAIASGRAAVLAQLAAAVEPAPGRGLGSPDPELTARMLSVLADEAVRLTLSDPERYPAERILDHTGWMLRGLPGGS